MKHMKMKVIVSILAMCTLGNIANAGIITGGDYGGSDLILSDGDILSGNFTNVNDFLISAGSTVFLDQGISFSIFANSININGTLNGNGAGFLGGENGHNGASGSGPGAGEGGLHGYNISASGGGGAGGYGVGGNSGQAVSRVSSPLFATGGAAYMNELNSFPQQGSGGGGAGNHSCCNPGLGGIGGNGGGSISIVSSGFINVLGTISVAGFDGNQGVAGNYSVSGGGAGSGGGIFLDGILNISGLLDVSGGNGADFLNSNVYSSSGYGQGGGGGAAGLIKLSGMDFDITNMAFNISGGTGGVSHTQTTLNSTGGQQGYLFQDTQTYVSEQVQVPEPSTLAIFALGMIGLASRRFKKQ